MVRGEGRKKCSPPVTVLNLLSQTSYLMYSNYIKINSTFVINVLFIRQNIKINRNLQ